MKIKTKQDFVQYASLLSEFEKKLISHSDLINFDFSGNKYADENILWTASQNLPKVTHIPKKVLLMPEDKGPGDYRDTETISLSPHASSLGVPLYSFFHPDAIHRFFKKHTGLAIEIGKPNITIASMWLFNAIKVKSAEDAVDIWFNRFVSNFVRYSPTMDLRGVEGGVPVIHNLFNSIEFTSFQKIKILKQYGCRLDYEVDPNKITRNLPIEKTKLGNLFFHAKRSNSPIFLCLDEGLVDIDLCNQAWLKEHHPELKNLSSNVYFLMNVSVDNDFNFKEKIISHSSWFNSLDKKWHINTLSYPQFQKDLKESRFIKMHHFYLYHLIEQNHDFFNWKVPVLNKESDLWKELSMDDFLSSVNLSENKKIKELKLKQNLVLKSSIKSTMRF